MARSTTSGCGLGTDQGNVCTAASSAVYTDGEAETLRNAANGFEGADIWSAPGLAMSTPSGGWTWAKVQALEAKIWINTGTDRLEIAAMGVVVTTTATGESTTDPYRTIDEAADAVAAGDTVHVGAGVYREQVTMDTSGTNGNEITFVADVDGALGSGDPGLVIISAYADEQSAAARQSCLDPNEKDFIEWRGFVMTGGTPRRRL